MSNNNDYFTFMYILHQVNILCAVLNYVNWVELLARHYSILKKYSQVIMAAVELEPTPPKRRLGHATCVKHCFSRFFSFTDASCL